MANNNLTTNDITEIITLIKSNYENAYAGLSKDEYRLLIKFWHESLNIYPREIVFQAAKNAIRNSEFAPRISNIITEAKRIVNASAPTDEELWAKLNEVLGKTFEYSRYLSYAQYNKWASAKIKEIYDSLPDELKLYVVNASTLIEISEQTPDEIVFEKSRFFKNMPTLRQHYEDKLNATEFLILSGNGETVKKIEDKKYD